MSSIFLSHNRKDKKFVRRLANSLTRYGARVWVDEAEMRAGESLVYKIQQAIKQTQYLGVILSPDSVESEWVKKEVEIALNDEIAGERVKVIPILVRTCEIPGFLQGKIYIDFRRKNNWDTGLLALVRALDLNELDDERFPGKRVILLENFTKHIYNYFRPRKVEIEFHEDWSGVEYIKIENNDDTFEYYSFYTRPTVMNLINDIFRRQGDSEIKGIELREEWIISAEERHKKLEEICLKHEYPKYSYPAKWMEISDDLEKYNKAYKEWDEWLNSKLPVIFIY